MRKTLVIICLTLATAAFATENHIMTKMRQLSSVPSERLIDDARRFINTGQVDSAVIYSSVVAGRLDERKGDRAQVRNSVVALANLGLLYMTSYYDFRKSYTYMLEAKELAEHHHFHDLLATLQINIGYLIYYDNLSSDSIPSDVIENFEGAFDNAFTAGDHKTLISSVSNMIEASLEYGDTAGVMKRLNAFRQVTLDDTIGLKDYILLECGGMGAFLDGDYQSAARQFLSASENVRTAQNYNQHVLSALACAANIFAYTGQLEKVKEILKSGIPLAEAPQNLTHAIWLYNKMSKVCLATGDSVAAKDYNYRYLTLKDTLINKAQMGNSRHTQFQFYLDKANDEINHLSRERSENRLMLLIAAVVVVVITLLLVGLLKAYRRIRENYRALYQTNVELLESEERLRSQRLATAGQAEAQKRYQRGWVTDDVTRELYSKVIKVLETSSEIYQPGYNIDMLSEAVQSKSRYVSQAINTEAGVNFSALLNRYRIMEACRMLNDSEKYGGYTIEAIAQAVGFKSRSGFSVIFKSITGLPPSVYQSTAKDKRAR